MTRAAHVGLVRRFDDINLAVENIVRWHISAIRTTRRGTVTQVKHVAYGWMSLQTYYQLQKLHDLLPLVLKFIEGGYRLKAALWSFEIPLEVLASGTGLPMGAIFVVIAVTLYVIDLANGNQFNAWLDIAALALPFGELWLLYRGLQILFNLISGSTNKGSGVAGTTLEQDWLIAAFGGWEVLADLGAVPVIQAGIKEAEGGLSSFGNAISGFLKSL